MLPDPNQDLSAISALRFLTLGEASCLRGFGFSMQRADPLRVTFEEGTQAIPLPSRTAPALLCRKLCQRFEENVSKPDHIADLERRHKALKDEIAKALTHTSSDDLMIIDLKRRMLHLRDELELEWLQHKAVGHGRLH